MRLLDTKHQRAAALILLLGLALLVALVPFATGLIGIPVLYVIFYPVYKYLEPKIRPQGAAAVTVGLALSIVLALALVLTLVLVNQAPDIAKGIAESPLLSKISNFSVGGYRISPRLASISESIVSWLGTSAIGLIGTATRLSLNLTISLFGLFYLLLRAEETWAEVEPYIPFSTENTELLQVRFRLVTTSTIIGTGLTSVVQGVLVGVAFWAVGLSHAMFWGVVTVILAILPVVGSGLVWLPGVLVLLLQEEYVRATGLAIWGVVLVANVDNVIRPMVFRRYAQIHPLVTLVGAFAGIRYFGLLGLLVGPLALSYFFELIRMYREEYLRPRVRHPVDRRSA